MAGKLPKCRVTEFERYASQSIQGSSIATFQLGNRFTFAGKIWNFKRFFIR
jgi:hypothetical protein